MNVDIKNRKKYIVIESLPEGMTMVGTPPFACKKGSFTVEAAVLLPVLACFFTLILFFFQIMHIQLSVQSALEKTGKSLALLAVMEKENMVRDGEAKVEDIGYLALAKMFMSGELQKDDHIKRYVNGGVMGISLLSSELSGDYIILNANYKVKFPVEILGKRSFAITQKTCFRKWTGWHAVDTLKQRDMLVYITMYGEVYHMRKSCPYLALSIQKVNTLYVPILRNEAGSKYRECVACKKVEEGRNFVYVTKYGEKYHYSMECSGLKRTIYQKSLAEVEGMKSCTKCWK